MKRTRKNVPAKPAILPSEALEILASVVGYCQQAGLTVKARDVSGKLVIVISDARVASNEATTQFVASNTPTGSLPIADESAPKEPESKPSS